VSKTVNGPNNGALWQRADRVIPRGGIFFSRSARFAGKDVMPGFIDVAEGCRIIDVDGKQYIDFNCGNGPNLLGYRHPEIEAVARAQDSKTDLAAFYNEAMIDYAEQLVTWSGCMDWAIPVKNGSDATNLAIRTMRSAQQKPVVVLFQSAYHGFGQEIALRPEFDPDTATQNILRLPWNNTEALNHVLETKGDQLAGIMLNPLDQNPVSETRELSPEMIQTVEQVRQQTDALITVDDVRSGFRLDPHGSHVYLGIKPDLLCLGKALGNGHAVSALLGTDSVREGVERIQLTATYMFSAVAHRVGIAMLEIYKRDGVFEHIQKMGKRLAEGLVSAGQAAGHEDIIMSGPATMPTFLFSRDDRAKRARTFAREASLRGAIFHPTLNWFICGAHQETDIDEAIDVAHQAFALTPTEL
jgi:glutamate-1-semialdehyde 2,1-aminomutase